MLNVPSRRASTFYKCLFGNTLCSRVCTDTFACCEDKAGRSCRPSPVTWPSYLSTRSTVSPLYLSTLERGISEPPSSGGGGSEAQRLGAKANTPKTFWSSPSFLFRPFFFFELTTVRYTRHVSSLTGGVFSSSPLLGEGGAGLCAQIKHRLYLHGGSAVFAGPIEKHILD